MCDIFVANKELNSKETAAKKVTLESKPIKLGINLTNRCNLKCIMCPAPRWQGTDTLSKSAIENIYELLPYLDRINWQGGEIFIIDYIKDVFHDMLNYRNITHEITTNGLLLDEEWIELLLKLNVVFTFSIDSVVPKTYEYIRCGARFKSLLAKLELLNEMEKRAQKNLHKTMTVVAMRSNLNELELFVDFAKRYNFPAISFVAIMHTDSDENIFNNMTPEIESILNTKIENIIRIAGDSNITIFNRLPKIGCRVSAQCGIKESRGLFCSLPWTSLWVDVSREGGNVYPDCMCKQRIGNIYNSSILKFWNDNTMVAYRKNILRANFSFCNEGCVSGIVAPELLHYTS